MLLKYLKCFLSLYLIWKLWIISLVKHEYWHNLKSDKILLNYDWNWNIQDSLNIIDINIIYLINVCLIIGIVTFVIVIITIILENSFPVKLYYNNEKLEFFWTLIPCLLLVWVGIPTVKLIYNIEYQTDHNITIKVIGNQWYWTYDYCDFENLCFDRFILPYENLKRGDFRLLEVDNRIVIPYNNTIILLVTSNDVIHRWALPSLNIKIDANPGRLNIVTLTRKLPGIYFGQCSEICGANHRFIPIKVESCSNFIFKQWCNTVNN